MKIQLNTDAHIHGNDALAAHVQTTLAHALDRFSEHVTRVEVHLSDENGDKNGPRDQRCMLEARLEGRQPVAVTEYAETRERAMQGATQKLASLLQSTLGKLHDQRIKASGLPLSDMPADHSGPGD